MIAIRLLPALLALPLLAACAAAPPPPADPATVAANAREQAKLIALGECQAAAAADGPAAVERCMAAKGYARTDTPVAGAPIPNGQLTTHAIGSD